MAIRKSKNSPLLDMGSHYKLLKKYEKWEATLKNPKYIDLCFRLGKSCVELDERKKALEIFQEMVDTAQEIDFKLTFEQMILFSEMLIKPESNGAPVLDKYKKDLDPSQQDIYRLGWICNSLDEMKSRNFRPKQITECEAHAAIAYYRCQNYRGAYNYFMKSLDYKSRNLSDGILFDFISCGVDNMIMLNKKEELLQFYKIRSQYGNNNCSESHVNDMIALFALDWELYKHENLEDSPYFSEIVKSIDKLVNNGTHLPNDVDHLYVDFSLSLLNLGILSDWVLKLLAAYNTETAKSNGIFRYHYSKMKYYFMIGGKYNKMAVVHGNTAMTIYENDIVLRGQADPDNNMGEFIEFKTYLFKKPFESTLHVKSTN